MKYLLESMAILWLTCHKMNYNHKINIYLDKKISL